MQSFIKWAGGKRWLLQRHRDLILRPSEFNNYVEPFIGGGSIFFDIEPQSSYINDLNYELINVYRQIRRNWKSIEKGLIKLNAEHNPALYYQIRNNKPTNLVEQAIRFLYLNRTCWNGLYRVNLKNEFNVPIGTKEKVIFDNDDFERAAKILSKSQISSRDFEPIIEKAKENDFIFIDPPYTVKHNNNGFIKYNEKLFTWSDQIRLRDAVQRAIKRKAKVLILNANHDSIKELYQDMGDMQVASRASVIAGKSENRGNFTELIIKCYV